MDVKIEIEMLREARASLDGGPGRTLYRGRVYEAPLPVAVSLFKGRDRRDDAGPAAKPAGAADDWKTEEPAWELQMKPETYLEKHPRGPNAELATRTIAYHAMQPDA